MHIDWTMRDVFLDVYKSLGSELDFKVAWFDLSMINDSIGFGGGFVWFSCILLYVLYNLMPWGEKGKIHCLLNCCELKETWFWLLYLFIYFLCTSWNGLNFALLASIVYWHKVHPFDLQKLQLLIATLIIWECTSKQDEKKIWKVQQILFIFH